MATALTVDIAKNADAILRDKIERCRPQAIGKAIRENLVTEISTHLAARDESHPNQLGGKRTNFYGKAAESVTHDLTDTQLRVSVTQYGIRQRLLGGTIVPKNKQWITVPLRAEAHGKRAGEFNNLRFVPISSDTALLVEADRTDVTVRRKRKDGTIPNVSNAHAARGESQCMS